VSPVLKFGGENDLPGLVIDQSKPAGFAARIELEPECSQLRLCNGCFEHKREGIAFGDSV
jgi:hypothetical protein